MIISKVKIKFRDDKVKEYVCYDTPTIGNAWVTLYTESRKSLERIMLPMEGIAEIKYWYEKQNNRLRRHPRNK